MAGSVFWKGVKFWLTLLLAAYAAAAVTWLLLRENDGGVQQAQGEKPAIVPPPSRVATLRDATRSADEANTGPPMANTGAPAMDADKIGTLPSPKDWAGRITTARKALLAAGTQLGVPEPEAWVSWVVDASIPNLRQVLAADSVSREKAACLGEMEWLLQALTRELGEARPTELDLATLEYTLAKAPPKTLHEAARWSAVLQARGKDADSLHTMLMREWLRAKAGRNDLYVRNLLGYVEFEADTHPDLGFRRYEFVETVEHAVRKRWFAADERDVLQVAQLASRVFDKHVERYSTDHAFRAVEDTKANLFQDARLAGLYLRAHTASPYLICLVSDRDLGPRTRAGFRPFTSGSPAASEGDIRRADALLHARGKLYQSVDAEFRRRFASSLGLKPLHAPWGGRADMPIGVRSYADGIVSVVMLIDGAFNSWRRSDAWYPLMNGQSSNAQSPFVKHLDRQGAEGRVFAIEADIRKEASPHQRELLLSGHAQAAARQIWYWSRRQRQNWRHPDTSYPFVATALGSLFASPRVEADGTIRFRKWNGLALKRLHARTRAFQGNTPPWAPLSSLIGEKGHIVRGSLPSWAKPWTLREQDPMGFFQLHAAAFTQWVTSDETLRRSWLRWLDLILDGEGGPKSIAAFAQAFPGSSDALQRDFEKVLGDMLKEDPAAWGSTPPPLLPEK